MNNNWTTINNTQ